MAWSAYFLGKWGDATLVKFTMGIGEHAVGKGQFSKLFRNGQSEEFALNACKAFNDCHCGFSHKDALG